MNGFIFHVSRRLKRLLLGMYLHRSANHVNLWRTFIINFAFLPFAQARKFPIFIYGKMKLTRASGCIKINCPNNRITQGMVKLNYFGDGPGSMGGEMSLSLGCGNLIFEGSAIIMRNSKIIIWGNSSLVLGNDVFINSGVNIACSTTLTIGHNTRIGMDSMIFDTNFHYSFSVASMNVVRNNAPVTIGHHCWIGAKSAVMKGVVLPPYTTVGSNSLVNKNVTCKERTLIAGLPAKLRCEDFSRVFNTKVEYDIATYFADESHNGPYKLDSPLSQYD